MKAIHYILGAIFVLLIAAAGYLGYRLSELQGAYASLEAELGGTQSELVAAKGQIDALSGNLSETEINNEMLAEALENERNKNEEFEDQIRDISGTVGRLDQLARTDPELLQKYSRVYFLNEHYMPERLTEIDSKYLFNESDDEYIHREVEPYLEDMLEDAADDDIALWVASAFRSYDEQADLKGRYLVSYGSGSNTFSADQGYSEHQLGTTVDFTTEGLGGGLQGFGNTEAYTWLKDNAYKYGFVLSYPENNQYYIFEPWHWRFVGEELARDLREDDKHFYDIEQREIDEYLITIFE